MSGLIVRICIKNTSVIKNINSGGAGVSKFSVSKNSTIVFTTVLVVRDNTICKEEFYHFSQRHLYLFKNVNLDSLKPNNYHHNYLLLLSKDKYFFIHGA